MIPTRRNLSCGKTPQMLDYIHFTALYSQNLPGENAFRHLNVWLGWSKNPMIMRMKDLHPQIPISNMHGSGTFFDHCTAYGLKCLRADPTLDTHNVRSAGHDIHVDNAGKFNRIMKKILNKVSSDISERRRRSGWMYMLKMNELMMAPRRLEYQAKAARKVPLIDFISDPQ